MRGINNNAATAPTKAGTRGAPADARSYSAGALAIPKVTSDRACIYMSFTY